MSFFKGCETEAEVKLDILAWNEYRGWAKRARTLQASSVLWNRAALICVCVSAVCAAFSIRLGEKDAVGSDLSALAALFAAVGAFVGRSILALGDEPNWLLARATAESLKSECYKYAGRVGHYAQADALGAFQAERTSIQRQATDKGLSSLPDDVRHDDPRIPPDGVSLDWYVTNRIIEQRKYYDDRRAKNERSIRLLQSISVISGLLAVVFGVIVKTTSYALTPWLTTLTTLSAAIIAYGLLDRRKYLTVSYAALASRLNQLEEIARAGSITLPDLIVRTEDALQGEHKGWLEHTMQTVVKPLTDPAGAK